MPRRAALLPEGGACALFAAVSLLLGSSSCASTSDPASGDLAADLHHKDPRVRVEALIQAQREGRVDLIDLLLENLGHNDGPVRMVSATALRRLTGEDFGFKPYGTPAEQVDAVGRWQCWWNRNREGFSGTKRAVPSARFAEPGLPRSSPESGRESSSDSIEEAESSRTETSTEGRTGESEISSLGENAWQK